MADGLHYIRRLNSYHFVFIERDNRRNAEFFFQAFTRSCIARFANVQNVHLRFLLLHNKHTLRVKIDKQRLRFHIVFDCIAVFVLIRFHVLILQTENRLVIFLRRGGVFQEQHCVPFFHGAPRQHSVYGQRYRLFAVFLAILDFCFDFFGCFIFIWSIYTRNVDNFIAVQILETGCVGFDKFFQRIARCTVRQNNNDMSAHFAVLDFIVVKES